MYEPKIETVDAVQRRTKAPLRHRGRGEERGHGRER
jgi:hypothetical protein